MDPDFPFAVIDYSATPNENRIHWHPYLEIALCTEGKGTFIFSQKEYEINPGDIFLANNFENHVAVSVEPGEAKFTLLLFLPEFLSPIGSHEFEREYLRPFMYNPENFHHKIEGGTDLADKIRKEIMHIRSVWNMRPADYRNVVDISVRKLLYLLMQRYDRNDSYALKSEHSRQKIQTSLDFIRHNFQKPLKLSEMAEMEHMSETSYRVAFKTAMHMHFKDYIHLLRVTQAKQILVQTELSVSKVALESGYSNINQFYMVFEKYVGQSPFQYRKSERSTLNYE